MTPPHAQAKTPLTDKMEFVASDMQTGFEIWVVTRADARSLETRLAEALADKERLRLDWLKYRLALNRIAHPAAFDAIGYDPKEIARRALLLGITVDPLPALSPQTKQT